MIEAARELIDIGLPIIPLCPHDHSNMSSKHIERCKCAGKTPLIAEWQNHSSTSTEELNSWIRSFKTFNIGLPLGDASGYCGIDVDGPEGVSLLQKMSGGDLPCTWEFVTGAGSRLLYAIPAGMKTKKFKQSGEGVHQECALICNGQQTVLPPSIHYTGKVYQWIEGHSPWDIDCEVAPDWLLALIELKNDVSSNNTTFSMEFPNSSSLGDLDDEFSSEEMLYDTPPESNVSNKNIRTQTGKSGHKIVITDEMLSQPIPEGNRDNTMTAIVGHYCANRDLRRFGKEFIMQICLKHNIDYCQPPLDDSAIKEKVEYFFNAESAKDANFSKKKERVTFEASAMAKNVIAYLNSRGIFLHFDQYSKTYYYTTIDSGPWQSTNNYTLIQRWIREVITSPVYGDSSFDKRSCIEETRAAIEEQFTVPYKKVDDFDLGAHSDDLCDYIVVNNGMVDWKGHVLVPWDPKFKTTLAFNVDYDETATCPNFERYVKEWLPEESVRMVLQEFLGYCLIPNTNFRKALFLYGRGKNGKSMLVEFLQNFYEDLSSSLSYDALFQRFGPANLQGKLVNIYDDTTVTFTKETAVAKNLIAGGTLSAEFKGVNFFQFKNIARFIFSSQETPRTSDNTVAWYDRWFFIKFPNQFRPSNKVKQEIQTNLEAERAGIFNWMLVGLERLMTQDEFTFSNTLAMYNVEYRSQNDNVTQFVNTMCTLPTETDISVSINDLYKVYLIWAEAEHLREVSKKVFAQRIHDMGYDQEKGYCNGKSGQSFFKNLTLNRNSEEYVEHALEISIALTSY